MRRKYLEPALLGLVLLAIIALAVYPYLRAGDNSSSPPPSPSEVAGDKKYSTDLNQLREKFNQDKGKVRLLLLLSPT